MLVSKIVTGYWRQWTDADCIPVVDFLHGVVQITSLETQWGMCARAYMSTHEKTPNALQAR